MARNQQMTMLSNVTWHSGPGAPPAGSHDFLTVAIHEFGHHLGLNHNGNASTGHLADEALSPMNGVLPAGTMRRTLQPTDIDAICHLYGCAPQPLTVSGLRNFDVVSPPDLDVNDFHITLHGITDPFTVPQGGTQIVGTFPAPFNNVSGAPTGWYPPTITALPPLQPTRTVVSYGGPGAQFVTNQPLHFGVSLTPAGEAALDEICMNWTQNGVPVFAGGNPQIPITVVTDHPVPGETIIQIVNQDCPEDMMPAPGRWIGPVFMGILDRHAGLDELVSGNPVIDESDTILVDGNTFLAGGEQLTLSDIDANSPIAAGKSIIVWYDVFEDDGGTVGRLVGTSYSAFNVAAVPEPRSACLVAFMCCIVMAARRQLMA
jgi:hypothetical protein